MNKLLAEYPYIVDKDPNTYAELGETWFDSVPDGWMPSFIDALEQLNKLLDEMKIERNRIKFLQVKEKFGRLCVYWGVDNFELPSEPYRAIGDIFDKLSNDTGEICIVCSKPATLRSQGWVCPYCYDCAAHWNKCANERHKTNYAVENCFSKIRKE